MSASSSDESKVSSEYFTVYTSVDAWVTKDGSTVRELIHPNRNGNKNQSLAEAIVAPGGSTFNHYHAVSEEIYHITEGEGIIRRGGEELRVVKGDTVFFAPGVRHYAVNTGPSELRILCFMTPPYTHEQTFLVDDSTK